MRYLFLAVVYSVGAGWNVYIHGWSSPIVWLWAAGMLFWLCRYVSTRRLQ